MSKLANHPKYRMFLAVFRTVLFVVGFAVLTVAFGIQARHRNAQSTVERVEVENIFLRIQEDKQLLPKQLKLWDILGSCPLSFERIVADTDSRLNKNSRFFDKDYIREQVSTIELHVSRQPKAMLYYLGACALHHDQPVARSIALLLIRECFSAKASVYYALRCAESADPLLSRLAQNIISNRYEPGGIIEKLSPAYLIKTRILETLLQ